MAGVISVPRGGDQGGYEHFYTTGEQVSVYGPEQFSPSELRKAINIGSALLMAGTVIGMGVWVGTGHSWVFGVITTGVVAVTLLAGKAGIADSLNGV